MVSLPNNYLIGLSNKLFKNLKKAKKKLYIDELIYKEAKNTVQRLIKEKKKRNPEKTRREYR